MTYKKRRIIYLLVFTIYIFTLLYLAIIRPGFYHSERKLNLTLFKNLIYIFHHVGHWEFARQFLGNIGWFLPFGFLLPLLFKKENFFITVFAGLVFSLFIEIAQFVFYKGIAELDDLILNTFGTIIGYVLFKILKKYVIHLKSET